VGSGTIAPDGGVQGAVKWLKIDILNETVLCVQ
jgi:hypothetical protein